MECAGEQGKNHFWNLVDAIYDSEDSINQETINTLAESVNIDTSSFTSCMESRRHATTWQLDRARGSALGVNSTPTIFVTYIDANGDEALLQFTGAQDYDQMRQLIDAILERIQ